jgi:hypothetical protein
VLVLGIGFDLRLNSNRCRTLAGRGSGGIERTSALLNPFPKNLGEVLAGFETVIIPELNMGQLALLIRSKFLVDAVSYSMSRANHSRFQRWSHATGSICKRPRQQASGQMQEKAQDE